MRSALQSFFKSNKFKIFLLVVFVLLLSVPVMMYARFKTELRFAFREAKNVKLALEMYDIYAYADNNTIFDSTRKDGMREGIQQDICEYLEMDDCYITLTSYDKKSRKILGFIYERNGFQVIYEYNAQTGDSYKINYILHIKTYNGE
ncbi:MAG: hypothetical protein Q4D54_04990 [Eubacteriales bacterium]|nr:hypothetical protein [Lachnospiraceae bacterium]MDO5127088.1 hypothetical protein [Eubacteriales bacterium]